MRNHQLIALIRAPELAIQLFPASEKMGISVQDARMQLVFSKLAEWTQTKKW
jgi:hypothetical protein